MGCGTSSDFFWEDTELDHPCIFYNSTRFPVRVNIVSRSKRSYEEYVFPFDPKTNDIPLEDISIIVYTQGWFRVFEDMSQYSEVNENSIVNIYLSSDGFVVERLFSNTKYVYQSFHHKGILCKMIEDEKDLL